jgi:hypothetical protein
MARRIGGDERTSSQIGGTMSKTLPRLSAGRHVNMQQIGGGHKAIDPPQPLLEALGLPWWREHAGGELSGAV